MKQRLLYLLRYYLFWLCFFVLQKPIFMLCQHSLMADVRWQDWFLVMAHGLPLDFSVAAYVTIVMGVWLCVSFWWKTVAWKRVADIYTLIMLAVGLCVLFADNGCFPSWGYHLNKMVFDFLRTPREVLACAEGYVWLTALLGFVFVWLLCWGVGYRCNLIGRQFLQDLAPIESVWKRVGYTLLMLLVSALLFLPIRGSVSVSTMNTGRVYFSDHRILNLAAINPVFNLVESLSEDSFDAQRYQYMSSEDAQQYCTHLRPDSGQPSDSLLTTSRPNIILFILESFSRNAMDAGAMPCLSQIAREGVFFDNIYASSHRTDRGVMAVLGAFPGCATSSVMLIPQKSQQLPQIGQVLRDADYQLRFFYGGDEDFTNMRSYLVSGGFEHRVADRDFPVSERLSKWGVPDHIVFSRVADEIVSRTSSAKTFDVILSLSSHEPFTVPYHHFEHEYLNAIAYTDSCLGAFVETIRQSPKWDSTLIVMVADHGYPYPDGIASHDTLHYRIPLVFAGGALRSSQRIHTLGSQVDWVPTVLHQMSLPAEQFTFAKDLMDTTRIPFAYYNFVDGFALLTPTETTIIDAAIDSPLMEVNASDSLRQSARAFTQSIMELLNQL